MRLAIDAMGNDQGARPIIEGVKTFLDTYNDAQLVLVGRPEVITAELARVGVVDSPRIEIVAASQVMEMHDKVADLREKKDSSIIRLVETAKDGRADAIVALGNTAAAVGATTLGLRHLKGVKRSGIAVPLPSRKGVCVVIDMGANTAAKPEHMCAYAVMASIYCEHVLGVKNPRVGLLNVGEEAGKGNEWLRQTFAMLEAVPVNFVGNVEGRDIYAGTCDVVVCDGFVGNVVLKASEELAATISAWLKEVLMINWVSKLGAFLCRKSFAVLKKRINYETYGGAPLLGVNGICIIGHGRSSASAVFNALRVARESVLVGLNSLIGEKLVAMQDTLDKTEIPMAEETGSAAPVA